MRNAQEWPASESDVLASILTGGRIMCICRCIDGVVADLSLFSSGVSMGSGTMAGNVLPQSHREEGDAILLDFISALLLFPGAKLV